MRKEGVCIGRIAELEQEVRETVRLHGHDTKEPLLIEVALHAGEQLDVQNELEHSIETHHQPGRGAGPCLLYTSDAADE